MTRAELFRRLRSPAWLYSQARDTLLDCRDSISGAEFARLYRTVRPYTMSGNARLRGLYDAVHHALSHDIPGDVVECGAARGGSAALMGLTLRARDSRRRLWLLDTFEGLPAPTQNDPDFEIAKLYTGMCRGTLDEVSALFHRLDIADRTVFVKGLFQDTLPSAAVGPIAVLHLDGDWYESVKVCLDRLYDQVSSGGVIQIDDYGHWKGARAAVDEFMRRRKLTIPLSRLDYTGRQLIKP
jgi:hypothetical protein